MKWCFLCHTEFPEDTPVVMTRGGSHLCVPCSQTERGAREVQGFDRYAGYRPGSFVRGDRFRKAVTAVAVPALSRIGHGKSESAVDHRGDEDVYDRVVPRTGVHRCASACAV